MSLKAFHVFFVIVSTLFCGYLGVWSFLHYRHHGEMTHLILTIISFAGVGFLAWYFKWFLKKLKNVSYL